jgi:hypothetical protein
MHRSPTVRRTHVYDSQHMLLQWSGTFVNGLSSDSPPFESFVGGLRFAGPGLGAVNNQATADALADILDTYWRAPASKIPVNCRLTTVKWNLISREGRYVSQGDTQIADTESAPGGDDVVYPTQIAWATSWVTSRTRGRGSKGRTFWPTSQRVTSPTTAIDTAACQGKANHDWALIQSLNGVMSSSAGDGVVATVMSNIGEGTSSVITGCRVGNRLDVQRRRGAQIDEAYRVAPIIPIG